MNNGHPLRKPRILVAPLDWGLGHATRCIPLIKHLISLECEVWIAAEKMQLSLLKDEFPGLFFLDLPGYRVRYSMGKRSLSWKILMQIPKIQKAIKKENTWLKEAVDTHQLDAVISDNRFGLSHPDIPCVFVTHQLNIKSPWGKWTEKILNRSNYNHIKKFTECWIPDLAGENNFAGELSHPAEQPEIPVKYIGLLTRFEELPVEVEKDKLVFLLSGPEPQRTILENKIIHEIGHYHGKATITRGLPASQTVIPSSNMIRFYNHLPSKELNHEIQSAEWIICRSGYSSIMDMMTLKKKCIVIPTPGQTEQEYLGTHLSKKNLALSIRQNDFTLSSALEAAQSFHYKLPYIGDAVQFKTVLENFVAGLLKSRGRTPSFIFAD